MKIKYIIGLIVLTALVFINSLNNGFVGDDEFLFVENPFYHSLDNLPDLMSQDYIADQDAVFNSKQEDINSGSVGYRPILSATYFLDYLIWQQDPFGYHVTNLIIHLLNTLLVFLLMYIIFCSNQAALVSSLIFALHPLKSEAVCSIGYRADSLACFFVLLAFILYIKSKEKGFFGLILSYMFFFMAVFTKESAVVFPALIITYDYLVNNKQKSQSLKNLCSRYLGFIIVLGFYLYVYIKVFPNSSLDYLDVYAGSLAQKFMMSISIFSHYISVFLFPMLVKQLPPLYTPQIESIWSLEFGVTIFTVLAFLTVLIASLKKHKKAAFFLIWFLFCFIPVSNIISIANPMAYRFMYLPSIGLSGFLAWAFIRIGEYCKHRDVGADIYKFLSFTFVLICIIVTFFLNLNWSSNTMMALAMVKDYPDYPVGHMHAGMMYFNSGQKEKAIKHLKRSIELESKDPRSYYMLGLCYIKDFEKSRYYFEQSVRQFPSYAPSYTALGRVYLFEGRIEDALIFLQASVELKPDWKAYAYIIQSHLLNNDQPKAQHVLDVAATILDSQKAEALNKIYDAAIKPETTLPIDFGV